MLIRDWSCIYIFKVLFTCLGLPDGLCTFPPLSFKVTAEVGKLLGEEKVDAILCVAGGWAGGNAKSKCESFFALTIHSCLLFVQLAQIGAILFARADVFLYFSQNLCSSSVT